MLQELITGAELGHRFDIREATYLAQNNHRSPRSRRNSVVPTQVKSSTTLVHSRVQILVQAQARRMTHQGRDRSNEGVLERGKRRRSRSRSRSRAPAPSFSSPSRHSPAITQRGDLYCNYSRPRNQMWASTLHRRAGPSKARQHQHDTGERYSHGGNCGRGRVSDRGGRRYTRQEQQRQDFPGRDWLVAGGVEMASVDRGEQRLAKRPRKDADTEGSGESEVHMPLSTPPSNPPPYLKGALIAESNLFPRLINSDYEDEDEDDDDYPSSDGGKSRQFHRRNKNEEDRRRVVAEVKGTPFNGNPRLDIPTAVIAVITLVSSGERVDLEPALTNAFNEVRNLVNNNGGKDDVTVLNRAQIEVWGRWKQITRPAWLKHISLKLGLYEDPEANEPVWVQACWVWLRGMKDNEGIVEDCRGRVSIAHLEGRSIFWMTTPKESRRPISVTASTWSRSFDLCHLLFACPGLYAAILETHHIHIHRVRHLEPKPAGFQQSATCDLVDIARWYAGKGMQVETADKICHYSQQKIRARCSRGFRTEDAVWVSKWLVHRRHIDLPSTDEANWFEPKWAAEVERDQARQACFVRTRKDLLEGQFSEQEALTVLADFDVRRYTHTGVVEIGGGATTNMRGGMTVV